MRTFSSHLMTSPWSGRTNHLPLEALREASAKYELTGQTGSLMYMAPEVYNGQPYNEKADVFSFGMMMYEVRQLPQGLNHGCFCPLLVPGQSTGERPQGCSGCATATGPIRNPGKEGAVELGSIPS
jgi:serine/threonine protein kinase